jgi:hypothetical protein
MDMKDFESYSSSFESIATGVGIVVGGIWAYFKFIKGRLLSPKIELGLAEKIIETTEGKIFVSLEVSLKNIGSIRLSPMSCCLNVMGLFVSDGQMCEEKLSPLGAENILPFRTGAVPTGLYYIDPGESSFRSTQFAVDQKYCALCVILLVSYNKKLATERAFCIDMWRNSEGQRTK